MYLDINDFIFKRQTFNINIEKTYYKVHQVPLRNFKEVSLSIESRWWPLIYLGTVVILSLVKIMGPELELLG